MAIAGCGYPSFEFRASDIVDAAETSVDTSSDDTMMIVDAMDESAADTTIDEVASDTGADASPLDSGLLDSGPPDTGPTVGCASAHVFCDDFEASTDPWDKWGGYDLLGGGIAKIDTAYVRSGSSAFLTYVPATGATATDLSADINKAFTPATSTTPARIDLWIRTDTYYDGETRLVAKLMRGTNGRGVEIALRKGHVIVDVLGAGTYASYPYTAKPFNGGQWYHLRLEALVVASTAGWFRFYADDMSAPVLSATGISTADASTGDVRFSLGFYSNGSSGDPELRARIDDASFDWL
jgi:hypothetical protein